MSALTMFENRQRTGSVPSARSAPRGPRLGLVLAGAAVAVVGAACRGGADVGSDPSPEALDPSLRVAPLPYTAEQIRQAHPNGTEIRFREQQPSGASRRQMRFSDANAAGVTVSMVELDDRGAPVGRAQATRSTWRELQSHAAFPAAQTRRERADCVVPAGEYSCWHYIVADTAADGRRVTSHYWFADRKPGPPVRLIREFDGQEVYRMELVDYRRGPTR